MICLLRQIAPGGEVERMQSMALGFHAGPGTAGSGRPSGDEPAAKPKKVPNTQRLVATKIAQLSAKNAEILSWTSKVSESDKLYLG